MTSLLKNETLFSVAINVLIHSDEIPASLNQEDLDKLIYLYLKDKMSAQDTVELLENLLCEKQDIEELRYDFRSDIESKINREFEHQKQVFLSWDSFYPSHNFDVLDYNEKHGV